MSVFCPHCDAALPTAWARQRVDRCPTCRLVVGAGRATDHQGDGITLSGAGTAAGILGAAARRESAPAGDRQVVAAALCEAARTLGREVARLRMLDYQHAADADPTLPGLGVVLSTFGTWKLARLHAADLAPRALLARPPTSSTPPPELSSDGVEDRLRRRTRHSTLHGGAP